MPNFWKCSVLIIALTALTGCPTPPKPQPRVTPLAPSLQPAPLPVARKEPEPPRELPRTNLPSAIPSPVQVPTNRWVSLNDWNRMNGFEAPMRSDNGWGTIFRSRSPQGVLSITMGSRVAYWNGLALALGFVPRLTNEQAFLHGLDIVKNVAPLLSTRSLTFKTPRVVVIDPGHGGKETGATNIWKKGFEKDYTLDWALRLRPLLASSGWTVVLTRTADVEMPRLDRVRFADSAKADLFVSLHFNSVGASSARADQAGIETYCLTPVGMPSNLIREFKDNPSTVYRNNAFDQENFLLALRLHKAMIQFSGRTDRGIRRARFLTVLREQNRPAVLLEGGYLSDPEEARFIASGAFRQKLAEAVAKALE